MKTTATIVNDNNKKSITFNANGFIIPNAFRRINEFPGGHNILVRNMELNNSINGTNWNIIREPWIQIWLTSIDEVSSENLSDHNFMVLDETGETKWASLTCYDYIPARIFKDAKEGDIVTVHAYIRVWHSECDMFIHSDKSELIPAHINVSLKQKDYRYKSHGSFEKVFTQLENNFNIHHSCDLRSQDWSRDGYAS